MSAASGFTIVNLIHIGNEVYNFEDLSEEKKKEVSQKLNEQAFEALGCKIISSSTA